MFRILWSISYVAILSLQPRAEAFLVQKPFPASIANIQPWRHPRMPQLVSMPLQRHLQPSFAKPIATATEGVQSSLGKLWSTVFGLLLPFREAAVPLVALASSNEWQVNLVKHVLTLISIRFVFSTIVDYKRQTSFQWKKLPRYLLASGLVALGGIWLDSKVVIPYYGINLLKHVAALFVCTRAIALVRSRRKTSEPSSLNTNRKADKPQTVIPKKSVGAPPPAVPKAPSSPPRPSPQPKAVQVEEKVGAVLVTKKKVEASEKKKEETPPVTQSVSEQRTEEVAKEEGEPKDESKKKENSMDESLNEWFQTLAYIQDELAEIQLKVIPEIFSIESYERTQERITKFQMEKVLEFFADDDDD